MKKIILLFAMMLAGTYATFADETMTSKLYATFGSLPGGANAKLGLYSWTATTNNLVQLYTFSNGELANYTTLKFTLGDKENGDGMIRVGYKVSDSNDFSEFGSGFGSSGDKSVDLSTITDKTTVTEISFGGRSGTGTVTVYNVYLTNANGDKLYPTYGTVGGSATFYDYSWTATTNNLWPCFEVTAGVLDNYSKLYFTLSNAATGSGAVRMIYNNGSDLEFGNGFSTLSGTKDVDISSIDNITKISFGGRNNGSGSATTGSVNLRDVYVSNTFDVTSTTAWTWSTDVPNNTISYDRSFTTDQASTVCLPFALTQDEADEAGAFYAFTGESSGTLTFTKVTSGGTTAYTPYIFVPSKATPFASLTGKTIVASSTFTTNGTVTKNGYTFKGTLAQQTVTPGAYGFSGGTFKKAGSGVSIKAFRAYITSSGGNAPSILGIDFGDGSGTTGISTVESEKQEDDVMYNLQGQRVSEGHKGLVIKNGRKYVVK